MVFDVYIIHAPEDAEEADVAHRIRARFEVEGIRCLRNHEEPRNHYGERAAREMIFESRMVLLISSSNANRSEVVERQLRWAVEAGKFVMHLNLEQVEPTHTLRELLEIGRSVPECSESLEICLDRIVYHVREHTERAAQVDVDQTARMKEEVATHGSPVKGPLQLTGILKEGFTEEESFERNYRGAQAFTPSRPVDLVDCSVFAPATVSRAEPFLLQVFAHCPDQAEAVRLLAKEFDPDAERRGKKTLEVEIERGTRLTFHLVMPGLIIPEPQQKLIWLGDPESVQFEVTVPEDFKPDYIICTVKLSSGSVPVGHIKFKLPISVSRAKPVKSPRLVGDGARAYEKVFISYASRDRDKVIERVQMLLLFHIPLFQDLLSLEPGARWEKQLYKQIDECDLFLLFWSSAAKESEWVLKEIRYALNRKGGDDSVPPEILPVIIEGPPPVAPPEELAHLHFNDYTIYFRSR